MKIDRSDENRNMPAKDLQQIEKKVHSRAIKRNIQKVVLKTVITAGLLTMAVVAPNAIQSLEKLGLLKRLNGRMEKSVINRARDRLLKNGSLIKNKDGFLRITPKGERLLSNFELMDYKLKIPRWWDKKWRMLIFDIPENRRWVREKIRACLFSAGFERVQDSVWVYPYPCDDYIALLKAELKIGKDLLYVVVEEIENDKYLLERFKLKK
ncbi:MAG: hypothetical protein WCT19_00130 [Candidatus Paceibacterota bacterium]